MSRKLERFEVFFYLNTEIHRLDISVEKDETFEDEFMDSLNLYYEELELSDDPPDFKMITKRKVPTCDGCRYFLMGYKAHQGYGGCFE